RLHVVFQLPWVMKAGERSKISLPAGMIHTYSRLGHFIDQIGELSTFPFLKNAVHLNDPPDAVFQRDPRFEPQQPFGLLPGTVPAMDLAAGVAIRPLKIAGVPDFHRRVTA